MKKTTTLLSFIIVTCSIFFYSSCEKEDPLSYCDTVSYCNIVEVQLSRYDKNILNFTSLTDQEKKNIINNSNKYLGYLVRDIAQLYFVTKDSKYKKLSKDIFLFIISNYKHNNIIQSKHYRELDSWYRDQFARDNFLLYESYYYTKDHFFLTEIEEQIKKWMIVNKRKYHNGYNVYSYGYNLKTNETYSYEIDPNQNLEIALLFSYLYYDSNSTYFKDPLFKNIIFSEVNAALSLMDKSGALSIREYKKEVKDSNYGTYASSILYRLNELWLNDDWNRNLKLLGKWLYEEFPKEHPWNTIDDYPNYDRDRHNLYNLIGRIPAFYAFGVDSKYVKNWLIFAQEKFPESNMGLETRWLFYKSIPKSYYIE